MKTKILGLFLVIASTQLSYASQQKQLKRQRPTHLNNRKSSISQNRNGNGCQTRMLIL